MKIRVYDKRGIPIRRFQEDASGGFQTMWRVGKEGKRPPFSFLQTLLFPPYPGFKGSPPEAACVRCAAIHVTAVHFNNPMGE